MIVKKSGDIAGYPWEPPRFFTAAPASRGTGFQPVMPRFIGAFAPLNILHDAKRNHHAPNGAHP